MAQGSRRGFAASSRGGRGGRAGIRGFFSRAATWFASHRRILGKAAIVLLLLALCALPPIVDNTVIGYLPLLVLVVCLVSMAVYVRLLARGISWEQKSALRDCRRGESVDFTVSLSNESWLLAPRIEVCLYLSNAFGGVDSSTTQSFSLLPKQSRDFPMEVRFDHIGSYEAGLRSIVVHDLLGLFERRIEPGQAASVLVMPRLVSLSEVSAVEELASESQRVMDAVISDGMDYAGMRDYVMGDPFKNIHWKASARFDTYLTRLYETQINPSMCVVVDGRSSWSGDAELMEAYDTVIELALSFDRYAYLAGFDRFMLAPTPDAGLRRIETTGDEACLDLLRAVPRLQEVPAGEAAAAASHGLGARGFAAAKGAAADASAASGYLPAAELVRRGLAERYSANSVVVCTAELSRDLVSALVDLRGIGKSPILIFVRPQGASEEDKRHCLRVLSGLSAAAVPFMMVSQAEEVRGGAW